MSDDERREKKADHEPPRGAASTGTRNDIEYAATANVGRVGSNPTPGMHSPRARWQQAGCDYVESAVTSLALRRGR
jgi:hypothetical protein